MLCDARRLIRVCAVSREDVAHDDDRCDETGDRLRWNDPRDHWKPGLEYEPLQLHAGLQEL